MKVEDLKIGDTINDFIVYRSVRSRFGVEGQVEVPILCPVPFPDKPELSYFYTEFEGQYYGEMHPYTFDSDTELDLNRYVVIRNGERIYE